MKTAASIILVLAAFGINSAVAQAQAKPVPADVVAALNSISNQTFKLESKIASIKQKRDEQEARSKLEAEAGKKTMQAHYDEIQPRNRAAGLEIDRLEKQIAVLKLRDADMRKAYKVPAPAKAKKAP